MCYRWKCRINCICCMLEKSMITYLLLAAGWRYDNQNLRGWQARRQPVHAQHESRKLEEVWPREFAEETKWSLNICILAPVRTSQPSSSLSYSTHPDILCNKRKRKETGYIFIHQCCCLCYITLGLKPHHQIWFSFIFWIPPLWGCITPL